MFVMPEFTDVLLQHSDMGIGRDCSVVTTG